MADANADLCLEVEPKACAIVVGPLFLPSVLGGEAGAPMWALRSIVEEGIGVMVEGGPGSAFVSDSERDKFRRLHQNAYELDPFFALRKVGDSLKKHGRYGEWLERAFSCKKPVGMTPCLQRLLELQRNGALLVYSHCDDALDRAAALQPILPEDSTAVEGWVSGDRPGFLHLTGVYSQPDSVHLGLDRYENASNPSAQAIRKHFSSRVGVFLGFESEREEPLQSRLLELLASGQGFCRHNILLGSQRQEGSLLPSCPLPLPLPLPWQQLGLEQVLAIIKKSSQALWKGIHYPPVVTTKGSTSASVGGTVVLCLLVEGKDGACGISGLAFAAPGVDFVLVSPSLHQDRTSLHQDRTGLQTVLLRVEEEKLGLLWHWVFVEHRGDLMGMGLMAVVLESGTFVWVRGGLPASDAESSLIPPVPPYGPRNHLGPLYGPRNHLGGSGVERLKPGVNVNSILSQRRGSAPFLSKPLPKIIPRYVVKELPAGKLSYLQRPMPALALHAGDDSSFASSAGGNRSIFERRASLPCKVLSQNISQSGAEHVGGHTPLVTQLAGSVQRGANASSLSYTALRQAMVSDVIKGPSRGVPCPSQGEFAPTLVGLLKSKREEGSLQVAHTQRRRSDPGAYTQQSFERRRELFLEENRLWKEQFEVVLEKQMVARRRSKEKHLQQLLQRSVATSEQLASFAVPCVPTTLNPPLLQRDFSTFVFPPVVNHAPSVSSSPYQSLVYNPFFHPTAIPAPYQPISSTGNLLCLVPPPGAPPITPILALPTTSSSLHQPQATLNSGVMPSGTAVPTGLIPSCVPSPLNISTLIGPVGRPDQPLPPPPPALISHGSPTRCGHKRPSSKLSALLAAGDASESPSPKRPKSSASSTSSQLSTEFGLSDYRDFDEKEMKEILGGIPNSLLSVSKDASSKNKLQLWQFFLELLLISANSHLIQWTANDFEFQIKQPDSLARLWGQINNNSSMNCQLLSKGLSYYLSRGIMSAVPGKSLTFCYTGDVTRYIRMRRSQMLLSNEDLVVVE